MCEIKFNKLTEMYVPGTYKFKNVSHSVNEFGYLGKKVDLGNIFLNLKICKNFK